jgi:hypothetical protein
MRAPNITRCPSKTITADPRFKEAMWLLAREILLFTRTCSRTAYDEMCRELEERAARYPHPEQAVAELKRWTRSLAIENAKTPAPQRRSSSVPGPIVAQ